jgi:hypothetical protein
VKPRRHRLDRAILPAVRAVLLSSVLLGACFTSAGTDPHECHVDGECSGLTCTRVGICAASTRSIRIEWTVHGLMPDQPAACAGVTELELAVADPTTSDDYAVRPVPCAVGSFLFDKLPLGYTEVTLAAYGSDSRRPVDVERGTVDADGVVQLALITR